MRDYLVTLIVFGSLPFIVARPHFGVVIWSWLAYMNPHRLCWGFAYWMPFAQLVAIATLVGMLFSREPKRIPWTRETVILGVFVLWMCLTTVFALQLDGALDELDRVVKIQLMTFVTLMLMQSRERLNILAWTIVLSIGFFGVKGGIFTILTGGGLHVKGPPNSFIGGNNEIGLAMLMVLPIMRYLQMQTEKKWVYLGLMAAMFLTVVAILGTQSRGAFLGGAVVVVFLILKSSSRVVFLILLLIAIPVALGFMPESWWERMESIRNYEQDGSAMGRINAWWFAVNLALDRPIGGGFAVFAQPWFGMYAPVPDDLHDAHSIWFEILAEHGFVGLTMFIMLGVFTWRTASWIIKQTRGIEGLAWASDFARMLQVSLVAYAAAGSFLGLAYFDLYYHMVAMTVICKLLVVQQLAQRGNAQETRYPGYFGRGRLGSVNSETPGGAECPKGDGYATRPGSL